MTMQNTRQDRNFDPIADHFAHKVYGSLKGQIRLAVLDQDLQDVLATFPKNRPLRILDVGAGLGQLSLNLAQHHQVTLNDISANMLAKAQDNAKILGVQDNVRFFVCPYQELTKHLQNEQFDLILCHALLEWLGEPAQILSFFDKFLVKDGKLSLCFYNPASLIYRNLVMGNFHQLDNPKPADTKSLTPNHPVSPDDAERWLTKHGYQVQLRSGIRVFCDYAKKQGGLTNLDDVIRMELRYSRVSPFREMGRYLHWVAVKSDPAL